MRILLTAVALVIVTTCLHAQETNIVEHEKCEDNPHLDLLYELSDSLIATQITESDADDFGALVCPSINPQKHPKHSRAAEAVYPLAVAYRHSGKVAYRDAAINLGNWLVSIQETSGAWGEDWHYLDPHHRGWEGTTADQLISLAGSLPILKPYLSAKELEDWETSIAHAADWVEARFPMGNLNYQPTGAVGLVFAHHALPKPKASWLIKAASLIEITEKAINEEGLLVGEGNGVDAGYNLAQSIGFMALYALLTDTDRKAAARVLEAHLPFIYPYGGIDNSWGTRSFKYTLESGTKTAPGVYFTFGLLADLDGRFQSAAALSLHFLKETFIKDGLVVYGPHANRNASSTPPCIYGTFARAQSIAMAIEYANTPAKPEPLPAQQERFVRHYESIRTAVVKTKYLMATVSAYGEISRYKRESVPRGGSLTHLWLKGFGDFGLAQIASQTEYLRHEKDHMPIEQNLLPLTPRVESRGKDYATNLYETEGTLDLKETGNQVEVVATGQLRTINGKSSGVRYRLTHRFTDDSLTKIYELDQASSTDIQIVEPFVYDEGIRFEKVAHDRVRIKSASGIVWELRIAKSSTDFQIELGENQSRYWMPFPGVECYPVTIKIKGKKASHRVELVLSRI
jgi:hypothetical protein